MSRTIEFIDEIYGYQYKVNIGAESDDCGLEDNIITINLKSLGDFNLDHSRYVAYDNFQATIQLDVYRQLSEDLGVLAHEIFHAAMFVFQGIGAKLSADSEECFAYYIEYITNKVLNGKQ